MISRIEAIGYRCLRDVSVSLKPFQILVGANGSGKSTLMDVVRFLGQLVADGLKKAIEARTADPQDLTWQRSGTRFELAIETVIPDDRRDVLAGLYDRFQYAVAIVLDSRSGLWGIEAERAFLVNTRSALYLQERDHALNDDAGSRTLILPTTATATRRGVLFKYRTAGSLRDQFRPETADATSLETVEFSLGRDKTALGNLPEDESQFPVATWFKRFLTEEIVSYQLDVGTLRAPSPPGQPRTLTADAANLPWVVDELRRADPSRFDDWIGHIRTALPDLADVTTFLQEENRHRNLILVFDDGLRIPSWAASEGMLRLLGLTIPAYLYNYRGVLLVEEAENGLHPRAIETAFQSLRSVYDGQVLLATHSPILVAAANLDDLLCFTKEGDGATKVVPATVHPRAIHWKGEVDLGTLFAAGVFQ